MTSQYAAPGQRVHYHYHGRSSNLGSFAEPCPLTREACERSRDVTHRLIVEDSTLFGQHAKRGVTWTR